MIFKNKYFYLAVLLAVLTSCKTTKDITKTKTEETTKTEVTAVESSTVTEIARDTILTPGSEVTAESNLNSLVNGDSTRVETPNNVITNKVVNGKILTRVINKPQKIPVNINKTTVTNKKTDSKVTAQKSVSEKKKAVIRESGFNWNYAWWLLLLLAIPIWKFRKYLF